VYDPGKPTDKEYEKQKLIAAFQMTYWGAPFIYYGDEVGMWGGDDPHDRKPMVWDELDYADETIDETSGFGTGYGSYGVSQNKDLLSWYKKVISFRNQSNALRLGKQRFLYISDSTKTFAFERTYNKEKMICAFNLDDYDQNFTIQMDESKIFFTELICSEEGSAAITGNGVELPINIPANSVRIYKIKTISK